jgi:hypothetical protein
MLILQAWPYNVFKRNYSSFWAGCMAFFAGGQLAFNDCSLMIFEFWSTGM